MPTGEKMTSQRWFHGLAAAFIGGVASAVDSGLALIIMAPDQFNINAQLKRTLITISVLGILSGAKLAFAYLKQSPLPTDEPPKST
jgi:hypothetical protein